MARSFDACVARIAKLGNITEQEARRILEEVDSRADANRMKGERDPELAAAIELAGNWKEAAKKERLDALLNASKRNEIMADVETNGGIEGAAKSLRSMLHWVPGAKRLDSIEAQLHSLSRSFLAPLGNALRQAGLEKVAISGQIDLDVSKKIWEAMERGEEAPKITGNDPASKIASAMVDALSLVRRRLNAVGANIGLALDYVTHTNWDARSLRMAAGKGANTDAAFAAWWAKDGPRMAERTFEGVIPEGTETIEEARLRFARSVFDATASGVHLRPANASAFYDDGAGFIPPAYEGRRNIAKGVSQPRVIYWKDAESWYGHMKDFGGMQSLYQNVSNTLEHGARNIALMNKLGTNPRGNWETVIRRIREKYRDDPAALAKFNSQVGGLNNVMDRLDGTANQPFNEDWARRFQYLQTWEALAHLGGVAITHIAAAPATVSAELAQHGVGPLDRIGHVLKAITTGRGSVEKQAAMAEAGAYAHGYTLLMHTKWQPGGGLPGAVSWLANNFMNMTGLEWALGKFQADGIKSVLMTKLGAAGMDRLTSLHPDQAALLRRYGIGDEEWTALRGAGDQLVIDGQRYISPKDAERATESSIKDILRRKGIWDGQEPLPGIEGEAKAAMLDRAIRKERWELADRLNMYLNDAAEHATVTPGVREQAMVYGSSRPGDVQWMITRALSQFKMWPLAAMNQILGREIGYSLANTGRALTPKVAANIGWLVALSTAGGALRMAVNDAASGRPQRNYMEPGTLLAALAQGGGLGIFGDFVFGETNRMGAGIVSTVAGPLVADADRLIRIFKRFQDDTYKDPGKAMQHLWPDAAHFAVGHVPFANLIYLKGALDYLLWYHLYEAASPGWFDRTNRRLSKETGRTMTGYVPGGGVPWGVPGVYLQNAQGQTFGALGARQ